MAFDDEITKLLANRSVYLDFSHVNNPGGIDWPDPAVRLYGKFPDNRGPYPIEGTVQNFGALSRAVCNADFSLEIQTLTIELIDPENAWRALAVSPFTAILYRWVQLFLRASDGGVDPYDQRIAVGQITKPDFPARKHVALECQLTGGKWLGELIPRRVVTLTDFPRAAAEVLGKAVPIVFGIFSNAVGSDGLPIVTAPGCSQKETILLQESWANGNGSAFDTGFAWEANVGGSTGSDPVDLLYPTLGAAEAVSVHVDPPQIGYGINALGIHPDWTPEPPDDDWAVAGVAFRLLGPPGIVPVGTNSTYYFDATAMWARFTYYPDQYPLTHVDLGGDPAFFCPLYTVWPDYGYSTGISVNAISYDYVGNGPYDFNIGISGDTDPAYAYLEIEYYLWEDVPVWDYPLQAWDGHVKWGRRADLIDTRQDFVVCHKCGTYTYDPVTDSETVANDGYLKVFVNGQQVWAHENIPLIVELGWYESAGPDNSNLGQTISFGWYGLVGLLTNILVTSGADEVPVVRCQDEPGTSVNMASGALRGLLVDGGAVPTPGTDVVPSGFTPDTSMPTVTGHEAHNVFGGGTITKAVFFYVAARKVDGTVGPISAIVDLDNAYDPDQLAHAASLSWWQAGDATAYVVWMTQDPNFHPVTNPTPGNPRTKTISTQNGSTFPPIDESDPPFDYQILFTSLEDGEAYLASNTTGPYRYLLAGHTLQAVDQVYVLKPIPTVAEDAPVNTLIANVAVGASSISIVYSETAERFREGQEVIIAGDPLVYTVTSSASGVHGITPSARMAFTTGTTVSGATDVETQVLMTEGVDYTQEVIEVNGNRYHTLVFAEAQQNPDTCEQYEITANVRGSELNADGTGVLIEDGVSIVQHFFKNWIFNDYRSSIGPFAPSGNKWFEDVPYAPGLINNDSFYAANLVSSGRVAGNYKGSGALTEQIPATQLIHDLITCFDLDLYFDNSTGTCAWSVAMLNTGEIVRASTPLYEPSTDVIRDTFRVEFGVTPHYNVVQYFAGPMTGRLLGQSSDQSGGWVLGGEVKDSASIDLFGMLHAPPLELKWTRHAATAHSVAYHRLRMMSMPSVHARMSVPIGTVNDSLATTVRVTHPDGLGPDGWVQRVCRIMRSDIDLDRMMLHLLLRDIDDLVP
jgi:hypothetical protein